MVVRDSAELITNGWIETRTRGFKKDGRNRDYFSARVREYEIPQTRRITIYEAIRGLSDVNALFIIERCVALCGFKDMQRWLISSA